MADDEVYLKLNQSSSWKRYFLLYVHFRTRRILFCNWSWWIDMRRVGEFPGMGEILFSESTNCIFSIVLKMESPVICPIVFHDVVLGEAKQLTHSFWGEFCFVLRTVKLQLHILHSLQQHQSQTRRPTIVTMDKNELILAPPSSAFSMRAQKEASRSRSMETPSRKTFKDESSALLLSHSRPLPNAESAFMSPFFTSRPGHFMTTGKRNSISIVSCTPPTLYYYLHKCTLSFKISIQYCEKS